MYFYNTFIRCIPDVSEGDYPILVGFNEHNNILWNCDCMTSWFLNLPTVKFKSICPYPNSPATTHSPVASEKTSQTSVTMDEVNSTEGVNSTIKMSSENYITTDTTFTPGAATTGTEISPPLDIHHTYRFMSSHS
jgi:hypothetical protein